MRPRASEFANVAADHHGASYAQTQAIIGAMIDAPEATFEALKEEYYWLRPETYAAAQSAIKTFKANERRYSDGV